MPRLTQFLALVLTLAGCGDDVLPIADVGVDASQPDVSVADAGTDVGPCPAPSINLVSNQASGAGIEASFFITPSGTGPLLDYRDASFELVSDDTSIVVTGVLRPSGGMHIVSYRTGHALLDFPTGFAVDAPVTVRIQVESCLFDVPFDLRVAPDIQRISESDTPATVDVDAVDVANGGTVVFSTTDANIDRESDMDTCAGGCADVFRRPSGAPISLLSAGLNGSHARSPRINDDGSVFSYAALGASHVLRAADGSVLDTIPLSVCTEDCDAVSYAPAALRGGAASSLEYAFADVDGGALLRLFESGGASSLGVSSAERFDAIQFQPDGALTFVAVGGAEPGLRRYSDGVEAPIQASRVAHDPDTDALVVGYELGLELRSLSDLQPDGALSGEPLWRDDELGLLAASDDLSFVLAWREATGGTVAIVFLRREGDAYERVALPFGRVLIPSTSMDSVAISSDGKWGAFISQDALLGRPAGVERAYRIRIAR